MKERSAGYRAADRTTPEEVGAPQAISFIVRIWKQNGRTDPECRGWVEHVQSGQRTTFLGLEQLLPILATYLGISARRGRLWRDRLMRWRVRVSGWFARGESGSEVRGGSG